MHRLLKRQLRRALQLPAGVEPDAWLQARQSAGDGAPPGPDIDWPRAFAQLAAAVGDSYAQLDRDLDLRARSLDISSKELFELNERLRSDLQARAESERLLLEAADRIAAVAGLPAVEVRESGMQSLSRLISGLSAALAESQRAKAASELRLALAVKSAKLGLWDWDTASSSIFFDETFAGIIGREDLSRDVPNRFLMSITHPEDGAQFNAQLMDLLRGRIDFFEVEHRVRHRQGHWVWLHTFGNVTARDAHGRAQRVTGVIGDITARKRLEAQLAENLQLVESLLEAMPVPVIVKDRDGRVMRLNAAWERLAHASRAEQVGQMLRVMTPAERELTTRTDFEVLTSGAVQAYETSFAGTDGESMTVLVHKAPLRRGGGEPDGVVSVITDITLQKRAAEAMRLAKQAAEAAAAAKAQFLANMSHELRTPLNGVVGMASMLATTSLDARQQRFVNTLRGSAEALITIINDVLDFSKSDAGKLEIAREPVALREQIDDVVSLFAARAFEKGLELAACAAGDVPRQVMADPVRLRQVLSNLVSNAIKFTERGQVLIAAMHEPDLDGGPGRVRFTVSDTGIGIPADKVEHVFDAFAQADNSITRRFGGTGLGLAICRQLVSGMGGQIGFDSTPGQGSRFWLVLPVAPDQPALSLVPLQPAVAVVIALPGPVRDAMREAAAECYAAAIAVDSPAAAVARLERGPRTALSLVVLLDGEFTHGEADVLAAWLQLERPQWRVEWLGLRSPTDARPASGELRCLAKPLPAGSAFGLRDLAAPAVVADPQAPARPDGHPDATTTDAPTSAASPLGARRVLVVEDNPVNQEIARAMLEHLGLEMLTAMNGAEGVQAVRERDDIDLVLMDCQMPVMDGFTAASIIRRDLPHRHALPIIALTGNAMPGDREACKAAGMDDYITKPIVLPVLEQTLRFWLQQAGHRGASPAPAAAAAHG